MQLARGRASDDLIHSMKADQNRTIAKEVLLEIF